jgi:hypothetical protein
MPDEAKLLKISEINRLDRKSDKVVILHPMKRIPKTDAKITFIASPTDQRIIAAGLEKYGIRKMSEVIRMALKKFAESEGLKAS